MKFPLLELSATAFCLYMGVHTLRLWHVLDVMIGIYWLVLAGICFIRLLYEAEKL